MDSWVQSWRPRATAFCDFPFHLSEVLHPPRKSEARRRTCLATSSEQTWRSDAPKCKLSQQISALTLPRCLLYCACQAKCIFADPLQISRLPSFSRLPQNPHELLTFWQGAESPAPATKNDDWTSKTDPNTWCLSILTSKGASCTTACNFWSAQLPKVVWAWCGFGILWCSWHFPVCFAPQRCAARAALAILLFHPPEPSSVFWLCPFSASSRLCLSTCPCCQKFDV